MVKSIFLCPLKKLFLPLDKSSFALQKHKEAVGGGHTRVAICLVNSSNIPEALLYFSNYFSMFRYTMKTLFLFGKFYLDYYISNRSITLFWAITSCPFSASFLWLQVDNLVWIVTACQGNARAYLSAPWV